MAVIAGPVQAGGHGGASVSRRLRYVGAALLVAALAVWLIQAQFGTPGPDAAEPLPWWTLVPFFFVAERWPVVSQQRRDTPTVALVAAPLILGFFFVDPMGILAAYVLGALAAAAINRSLQHSGTLFAVGQVAVLTGVGYGVFTGVAGGAPMAPRSWIATYVAAGVLSTASILTLTAIRLYDGRISRALVGEIVTIDLVGTVAAATFGLIAAELLQSDPEALVLHLVLGALLLGSYRAFVAEREHRRAAEFLQGAGEALSRAHELESAIGDLIGQARAMFDAELVQLTLFPTADSDAAYRSTVHHERPAELMEMVPLQDLDDILEMESDGAIVSHHRSSPAAVDVLHKRGVDDAMVGVLRGRDRILGTLLVGGHVSRRVYDNHDLQLFQMLAIQTSTTLENGRLEQSIARLAQLQEQLSHQAFHDSLTDLANRALFIERIEKALSRPRRERPIAVLFIDLDDFKGINDTLGHWAGDELLVGVAGRLRRLLRKPDSAARLGGDEFAVLIEEIDDRAEADAVARRIFAALDEPFLIADRQVRVHASVGIAISDSDGENASRLMRHADVAMYAAKGAGKDRHVLFSAGMEEAIVARHTMRNDLERAVAEEQFVVHYQPVVELSTGEIVGTEALVRWRHPTKGMIRPDEFIPLAEESGVILAMGRAVMRAACRDALRLQAHHPRRHPLFVSINVSARQLQQSSFVDEVLDTLRDTGFRPQDLVLELTESILLEDSHSSIARLAEIRRHGIRVAIDDFGTGYSSLSYLRLLPVDILKIAKPFVDDLAAHAEDEASVARAVVGIGSALKLTLIAEGIEVISQLRQLRDLRCGWGQGYLMSHPLPVEELEDLLERGIAPAVMDIEPEANPVVRLPRAQ